MCVACWRRRTFDGSAGQRRVCTRHTSRGGRAWRTGSVSGGRLVPGLRTARRRRPQQPVAEERSDQRQVELLADGAQSVQIQLTGRSGTGLRLRELPLLLLLLPLRLLQQSPLLLSGQRRHSGLGSGVRQGRRRRLSQIGRRCSGIHLRRAGRRRSPLLQVAPDQLLVLQKRLLVHSTDSLLLLLLL